MASSPAKLVRKSPLLYRYVQFSRKPTSHFSSAPKIPPCSTSIRSRGFSFRSCYHSISLTSTPVYKELGHSKIGFRQLGSDHFRLFVVSDGGSGGGGSGNSGSGGGNSGDGGSGAAGGSGSGKNWSFLLWYLSLLEKYPVWTKAVTSAFLTFIGDLTCQLVIEQVPSLDWKRTFLFTLLGLVLVGPTLHFWYLYLSKLVTIPGSSGAFLRLFLDQFLFSPIFIGFFLSTLVTLEGRPSQVIPKLEQEWFSAVVANWQLWIPFQFLNFRFVPQQFQVLAANFIALIWNVILSYKAHKAILTK
ncbi:protein SYM1 isoform X1 [Coffea arabica]|uniref:Protein SYM1 isoform X1 n=1 Tax=Coffea arabica TaxID=13443 RepID=A0A6P6VWW9_COFAR|nr:protein SYM1-like isoform X1 [Coffea arabica]XP_027107040.1 protein SYM1-like isoform X1 [Coffea arabica]